MVKIGFVLRDLASGIDHKQLSQDSLECRQLSWLLTQAHLMLRHPGRERVRVSLCVLYKGLGTRLASLSNLGHKISLDLLDKKKNSGRNGLRDELTLAISSNQNLRIRKVRE